MTQDFINITPDYSNLVRIFLANFEGEGRSICRHPEYIQFSDVHGMISSLNVALQSIDSTEALELVRESVAEMAREFSETSRDLDEYVE